MDEIVPRRLLGEGSYGKVYTKQTDTGPCVTKKLTPSSDGISRDTARELHALFLMKGVKQIVLVLKVNIELTRYGKTLISIDFKQYTSDLYKFIKDVDFRERLLYAENVTIQLLNGLHALYHRGIIHRDVKPENILLEYMYDTHVNKLIGCPQCVIADLGLSRQLSCTHQEDETRMTAAVYSPWYRPPEILETSDPQLFYGFNSDIWAMGATLAEYYAGSPLYPVKHHTNQKMLETIKASLKPDGITVDLMSFYDRTIHRYHLNLIPREAIARTEKMLTYDFKIRPSINQIVTNPILVGKATPPLKRGELMIDDILYEELIVKILSLGDRYKFDPVTVINAIGLLERYLANSHPKDEKMIPLISIVAVSLSALLNEIQALTMTDYYEMADKQYEIQVIKEAQVIIASTLKYCFSTCEVDVFVSTILDQPKPTLALRNTYLGLMKDHQRPQVMSYHDLAAAVSKYN